jgi:putative alpha-1,2-mannosidase
MSAWFLMSAIGLFQTDGGCRVEPIYEIGSPRYEKVTIRLHPDYCRGRTLTIVAKNTSRLNKYVQSATFNGKPLNRWWLTAEEIQSGGALTLEMGPKPNRTWGEND